MKNGRPSLINCMIKACDKASNAIIRDFHELEKLQVTIKSLNGFVTNADIKSETILMQELSYYMEGSNFLSEEQGEIINDPSSQYRWIIDGIDGTSNFIRGNAHFCISVALELNDGDKREIVAAVIYSPVQRELYWAAKGQGAYHIDNVHIERKIKVSKKQNFYELVGAICGILNNPSKFEQRVFEKLRSKHCKFRAYGSMSLDLIYIASGKFDFCIHDKVNLWDVAAGTLIVKEAGGRVSNFEQKDIVEHNGSLVASNALIYDSLFV